MKELKVSVSSWVPHSGLTEVRDLREVETLARALDLLSQEEAPQAMDALVQRICSVQMTKQKGGSWDRSEAIQLIDPGNVCLAPSGVGLLGR